MEPNKVDDADHIEEDFESGVFHPSAAFGTADTLALPIASQLMVHSGKCVFASDRIEFLGHHISANSLTLQEDKVAAVRGLPATTDGPSLQACKLASLHGSIKTKVL